MEATGFLDFDPGQYLPLPRPPIPGLVSMTTALVEAAPEDPPAVIIADIERVSAQLQLVEEAIDARRVHASTEVFALEAEFDNFVDGLWLSLRDRLHGWRVYERPGARRLAALPEVSVDYSGYIARAARARVISVKLFAGEGTSFVQRSYAEQSAVMASILRIVKSENLGPDIDALVGEDLLASLRDCQPRYEAMVNARALREKGLSHNLRALGERLRGHLVLYTTHVLGLADPDAPETLAQIQTSLRPILAFRRKQATGQSETGGTGGTGETGETDEPSSDEPG